MNSRVLKITVQVELAPDSKFHPGTQQKPETESEQLARFLLGYTRSLVDWATHGPIPEVTVIAEEVER